MLKDMAWIDLLSKVSDNPIVQLVLVVAITVYTLMAVVVKILKVHNEQIRFLKSGNIEQAIDKFDNESLDRALFKEIHAQSLFHVNTGINASLDQRKQILKWTTEKGIPLSMIRVAWSSIRIEKGGVLKAKFEGFDIAYFWYSVLMIALVSLWAVLSFILGVYAALNMGEIKLLILSAALASAAFILYLSARSLIYLRRLVFRLEGK